MKIPRRRVAATPRPRRGYSVGTSRDDAAAATQDATWLKGADWRGVVEVSFESEGAWYVCPAFVLVPHSVL